MVLESRLTIDLPYQPSKLVGSYGSDVVLSKSQQMAHLSYLGLRTQVLEEAHAYGGSFDNAQNKTLLHYRDYLISRALNLSLKSALFKEPDATSLTNHAYKVAVRHPNNEYYPPATISTAYEVEARFGDLLGSPAHYLQYSNTDGYPLDYLSEMLEFVWGANGLDYADSPTARLEELMRLCGYQKSFDNEVFSLISSLFSITDSEHEHYPLLLMARRNFLKEQDALNFTARLLTGQYADVILVLLAALMPSQKFGLLNKFVNNISSVAKPCGLPLLVQSFAIEGLVKAAWGINNLPEQQVSRLLADYLADETLSDQTRLIVWEPLTLSVAAINYLQAIQPSTELEAEQVALQKMSRSWQPRNLTPEQLRERLGGINPLSTLYDFTNLEPDNLTDPNTPPPIEFSSDIYGQLSVLTAVGFSGLQLSGNADYSDEVVYSAVDYTSSLSPTILFVSVDPNKEDFVSNPSRITRPDLVSSMGQSSIAVSNKGDVPVVAVAVSGSLNRTPGEVISLQQFVDLRAQVAAAAALPDAESATYQGVSSPIITYPYSVPEPTSSFLAPTLGRQIRNYYLFNQMNATNSPRGSFSSRVEAQGLKASQISTSDTKKFFFTKRRGATQDYLERLSGFLLQQNDIHVESEVEVLREWVESVQPIVAANNDGEGNFGDLANLAVNYALGVLT